MTDETPPDSKLTRSKQRWASEHKFITGDADRSAHERLPPGQHLVRDWPVLDLGRQPDVAPERWELKIGGLVDNPVTFDWKAFMALPQTRTRSDMHCVTTWSRYDNDWKGVATHDLLDLVQPTGEAAYVLLHGYDGYDERAVRRLRGGGGDDRSGLGRQAADTCARRPGTRTDPAPLPLEERQMAQGDRLSGRRSGWFLGGQRLPHARRPLGGGAILLGISENVVIMTHRPVRPHYWVNFVRRPPRSDRLRSVIDQRVWVMAAMLCSHPWRTSPVRW